MFFADVKNSYIFLYRKNLGYFLLPCPIHCVDAMFVSKSVCFLNENAYLGQHFYIYYNYYSHYR